MAMTMSTFFMTTNIVSQCVFVSVHADVLSLCVLKFT